jgi:MFS family permease
MMNSIYWIALSGSQMTVLPMMLVDPKFGLSPSGVGGMFALMSAVGVLFAQPAGYLADKYGKPPVIVVACSTIAIATAMFPFAETFPEVSTNIKCIYISMFV